MCVKVASLGILPGCGVGNKPWRTWADCGLGVAIWASSKGVTAVFDGPLVVRT